MDRVLAIAAVQADDMRCPGCGHPKHEAWNPDSSGWYELREAECEGCAPVQRASANDKTHRPQLKRWTVDERPPSEELAPWQPRSAAATAQAAQ